MNGNDSFKFTENVLQAFLWLLELATQIAIVGVSAMAVFIFVSVIYLCFRDVRTDNEGVIKNRRKPALNRADHEAIIKSRENEDSSLISEPHTPETLPAEAFFPRSLYAGESQSLPE